jgi:hypothetical protein
MGREDDVADNLEEALGDVLYRIEDNVKAVLEIARPFVEHANRFISEAASLHPIEAAKEVPATLADSGEQAGHALGATAETGSAAVGTVPATATDVLEDVQDVQRTVSKGGKSLFNYKVRRRGTR